MRQRRRDEEANFRPSFLVKRGFQFFKIIHSAIIRDQQLGLPKKFVRKFGKYLSTVAVLKVPSGKAWHVEIRKPDGEVWFHNKDWEEFIEYHSICVGHFLVFRYVGSSHFYVHIFDMSGTEILYPCNPCNHEEIEEDSVEVLGVVSPTTNDEHDSPSKQDKSVGVLIVRRRSTRLLVKKDPVLLTQKEDRAIESAKAFKSKHPFYMLVMRPAYVNRGYSVVPSEFVRSHMPNKSVSLKLKASNGRTWSVDYLFRQRVGHTKLSKGWSTFARDNNMKEGDVCVFELINKVDIVLKVSIFRVAKM